MSKKKFSIFKFLIIIIIILAVTNLLSIGSFFWGYKALTKEGIIAKVTFNNYNESNITYTANLYDAQDKLINKYTIYGDQWRLDAKFVKMKYWATLFGIESRYQLERFQGRYKNIEDENSKKHKAYDLGKKRLGDYFSIFGWNIFMDAKYGASTYTNISTKKQYIVSKTLTGIIVRNKKK